MKFVDLARIWISSGKGGDGAISFRKEKFVPKGGPDGGNGGRGGDVIFQVNPHLNTLLDFQFQRKYVAEDGAAGARQKMTGKDGEDIIIQVPLGTIVRNAETGDILADLSEPDQREIVAKGGNGGFGNAEFPTPTNQAPRYAKPGLPGQSFYVELELKLLADVGIVGFPNAGKSTLISVISAAKPKIADYPFTTLIPNLGIVKVAEGKTFCVADIPGLIEGASEGKGLGIQFLRHVERTSVLLFLIDAWSEDHQREYETLWEELEKFNPEIVTKKSLICISKVDSFESELHEELANLDLGNGRKPDMLISSVSGENIEELKWKLWNEIQSL